MRDRTDTSIGTVIGFPLGFTNSNQKLFEIGQALCDGADEVDIVLNISNIIDENWDKVNEELNDLHDIRSNCIKKIIVETCYLTEPQLDMVTRLVARYDFDYIKTSTGFGSRGVSVI
jgi:deoxyribose-phosphate aldolase